MGREIHPILRSSYRNNQAAEARTVVRLPTLLVAALAVLKVRNEAAVTRATLSLTAFSRALPGGLAARMASLGLPLTIIAEGLLEKAHAIASGYQARAIVPTPCLPVKTSAY